jgi:hypothetical protein
VNWKNFREDLEKRLSSLPQPSEILDTPTFHRRLKEIDDVITAIVDCTQDEGHPILQEMVDASLSSKEEGGPTNRKARCQEGSRAKPPGP